MQWPLNVSKLDTCLTATSYMENISILFLEANAGHFKLGYGMVGSLIQIRPLQIPARPDPDMQKVRICWVCGF